MILVDDHYLAAAISSGQPTTGLGGVATTCSWWWRLASALGAARGGALSAHFADSPSEREVLQRTVAQLPRRLTILDLRDLIPAMALLAAEQGLNLLAAEAVVAAEVLGAELVVRVDAPRIKAAAAARGIPYRLAG